MVVAGVIEECYVLCLVASISLMAVEKVVDNK